MSARSLLTGFPRQVGGILAVLVLIPGSIGTLVRQAPPSLSAGGDRAAAVRPVGGFGRLPIRFTPNVGQVDRAVAYYIEGRDKTIYFTPDGLTFVLSGRHGAENRGTLASRWVVKLDFVDSTEGVVPAGLEPTDTRLSFFRGKPEEWIAGVAACSKIVYRDLWPGIDLIYSGTFERMKYEFVVRPGADPSRIALAYRGAEQVALTADGRLAVQTPVGSFQDEAPVAYQEIDGVRRDVPVGFDLESAMYGFALAEYDRARTLVIDPSSLVYCGFIGGASSEIAYAITVDGDGSVYIAGATDGSPAAFPTTVGPDLSPNGGSEDAFIVKVNPAGTALVYCGYIGGSGSDGALDVAVDGAGNAYVSGYTDSPESTFPLAVGPDLTHNGDEDAFVAKVDPTGTGLVYCGYIGGASVDYAAAIAVDGQGNAYVSGTTASDETSFPVAVGPDLTHNGGPDDAFVAKVDSTGTMLAYCGYVGGLGQETASGIAVDGLGNAYISGTTLSSEYYGFPVTVGPGRTYLGFDPAEFAAKVNAEGTSLVYCGYVASGYDFDAGIAVDGSGNAYVAGTYLTNAGGADAFVIKVNAGGTAVVYDRILGGEGVNCAGGIAVDATGSVYVTGYTETDRFPTKVGPSLVLKGYHDAFVAKLDPTGKAFDYCGFIGGDDDDHATGIAVDPSGNAYITGITNSADSGNFPAIVGPDLTYNGGDCDVFVVKVPAVPAVSNPTLTSIRPTSATAGDPPFTMVLEGSDFVYGAHAQWGGGLNPTTFISDTELTADARPTDMWWGRLVEVRVRNPDGETSEPLLLTINNPLPRLGSISPPSATAGGGSGTIRLYGSGFIRSSTVRWNGGALTPTYISSTEMTLGLPTADLAAGGEFQVTVENSEPGGGISETVTFRIATFALSVTTGSATVNAGQTASYPILLTPLYGSFDVPVTLACEGLPEGCTASFSPPNPTPGADVRSVMLTLTTRARSGSAAAAELGSTGSIPPASSLLLAAVAFFCRPRAFNLSRRSKVRRRLPAVALTLLVLVTVNCGVGGDGNPPPDDSGTPSGTYQITVRGTANNLVVATPVTLTVR